MDESNLGNFELLLKKNTAKTPSAIYSDTTCINNTVIKPQDVLNCVYSQIKTIQLADGRSCKNVGKKLKEKSDFMTVSKLPVYGKVQNPTNTFETQCVSDTQLINIIEDAEALIDTHKGMTQEFSTDFNHTDNNIDILITDETKRANIIDTQDFETTFTQSNVDDTVSFLYDKSEDDNNACDIDCCEELAIKNVDTLKEICHKAVEENKSVEILCNNEKQLNLSLHNNCKCTYDVKTKSDNNDESNGNENTNLNDIEMNLDDDINTEILDNIMEIEERSLSPVLNIRTKVTKENSPLIVSLESFEKFERLAVHLIDNDDINISKRLINSQILNGELSVNTTDIRFNVDGKMSPILEKRNEFCNEHYMMERVKNITKRLDLREKRSDSLKDEILFSSDEENDFISNEDIPLTAALETSFYDHPNVLEDTMYVGFQTASNKSIQINTESFKRAQSILDENKAGTDFSFSKLVDICDEKSFNKSNANMQDKLNLNAEKEESLLAVNSDDNNINLSNYVEIDDNLKLNVAIDVDYDGKTRKPPEKQEFIGFKTASDKRIDLTDKALEYGKKILMEIKEDLVDQEKALVVTKHNTDADKYIPEDNIDDLIIQEFENIEMSLEETDKGQEDNKTAFVAFKTASDKNIKISDTANVKVKNVFQDIDFGDLNEPQTFIDTKDTKMLLSKGIKNTEETFVGFITANNKSIKISDRALAKTKDIFEKDKDCITSIEDYYNQPSTSKTDFIGFKTANNKNIHVSERALSKSSKIFNDIDKESNKVSNNEPDKPKSVIKNFKSARSMKIFENLKRNEDLKRNDDNISFKTDNDYTDLSKDIARSKKFQELDTEINKNQPNIHEPKSSIPVFKGFQTASKKPVNISSQALERSNKIFKDIDDKVYIASNRTKGFQDVFKETATQKEVVNVDKKQNEVDKKAYSLFKTASNKDVEISETALVKCRKIFDNINDTTETNKDRKTFGFQTANNKKVGVSEEALKKTKEIFKDFEISDIEPTFRGFQTSNKNVNVSKYAIEKTNNMFTNIDNSEFAGFRTGRNEKVDVSKAALEKSKAIFHDTETPERSFKGFQTASKKTVSISETALAKSKGIFKDIDDIKLNSKKNTMNTDKKAFSFQTANNKKIDICEDALNKSKDLLNPLYRTNTENIMKDLGFKDNLDKINVKDPNNTSALEDVKTPQKSKRSGSPILSCPRAKKKKFETPYKENNKIETSKPVEVVRKTKFNIFTENYKKNKVYKLQDLKKCPNEIDPYITNFNLDNILNFEFDVERNNVTHTKMSITQLKDIFLSAVNKNLVPNGWLDIHLKLILWKLLSYESQFRYKCTVKEVLDQLKYRYEKELYNSERSVLRRIYEKDDVPAKTMVLCVAGIKESTSVNSVANKEIELLLTDGWYFITAIIDNMLMQLICDGKIVVGRKIVTSGAELVNCEGLAPWEDTLSVRLKIFGNSTRPARWDTKLGYTASAILSQLSAVKVNGGKISRLNVYVTRVYPMLYVEKFEDGSTVTRSERLEHLHQIKYESERELMMERIYEEVQREFSDQDSQDTELYNSGKRKSYDSGSQIAKMMKHSKDPMEFRAQLTSSQTQLLQEHTNKYRERICQAIQDRVREKMTVRNVVTLARGRVACVGDEDVVTKGMLSIWKPNDAILDIFKEGSSIEIMNAVPTAIRYSEIQITAGRQSVFRATKNKTEISRHLLALKRTCYSISDVTHNLTITTDYNEIDTVGIVFLIEPSNKEFESNKNFQNVYLADIDKNIICVNFWGGIKKFGFENILDTGQIVACANLQKRAGNTRKNIPQFRVTELTLITKTPKNIEARDIVDDLSKKLFVLDRRKFCDDCIAIKNNYAALRCLDDSENESPYKYCKGDYSLARNKMFIDTPIVKPNRVEDANLNLSGLDFESTFKQDTQELSPKTLMRKKKVNEKIAKLKMYGEPPPLSPITIIDRSVNAKNSYKSPMASNTPIQLKNVAIMNNLPEESPKTRDTRAKSPVFSVKRTYVSVPVKLNFASESKNESVDHFAEEFDGSPPLSLD